MRKQPLRSIARAYTLVEILVVVTVMGIAASMVIPSIESADALRTQAAVRQLVSDLTFAQSDAIANQQQRAVVFDIDANSYEIRVVEGNQVLDVVFDPFTLGKEYRADFNDNQYGNIRLTGVDCGLDTPTILIFDEFGAPVDSAGDVTPTGRSTIEMTEPNWVFSIYVDGMTGQITTDRTAVNR